MLYYARYEYPPMTFPVTEAKWNRPQVISVVVRKDYLKAFNRLGESFRTLMEIKNDYYEDEHKIREVPDELR